MANVRAALGVISPVTRGRLAVLLMTASMSRSTYMLMALAPPAARAPPTSVATIRPTAGMPLLATTIVGRVVTRSSSMMRGLVSATYAPTRDLTSKETGRAIAADTMARGGELPKRERRRAVGWLGRALLALHHCWRHPCGVPAASASSHRTPPEPGHPWPGQS